MPARKNRPDKSRGQLALPEAPDVQLLNKFAAWEKEHPDTDHYVGWPDISAAYRLAKIGFLRESAKVTGCFFVTDRFKAQFMSGQGRA